MTILFAICTSVKTEDGGIGDYLEPSTKLVLNSSFPKQCNAKLILVEFELESYGKNKIEQSLSPGVLTIRPAHFSNTR